MQASLIKLKLVKKMYVLLEEVSKKKIVITGKDGSKIIQNQTETKTEETAVLRKKRNYVMYEAKLGTETTTDITKIDAPKKKEKPILRAPEPRIEEKIVQTKKKKEYLDNYQYHETKEIKNKNPRFQVIVEHQRLGDIIGGTFEETSYQRQVFAQGSNRPQLTEKTTTVTKTGSATGQPTLRGNKSQVVLTKTKITGSAPQQTTGKRTTTTTTTTTKTSQRGGNPATGGKEKVTETSMKRRSEGTGSKTETKTETKTTTSGRGGESSTTTKTTTRTTAQKPAESKTTQQTTTTKTTTRTTKTSGGDGGSKTETTVTKTETSGGDAGAGGSSIRKKYAKGRFSKQ
jgi:hypothetical protein